MPASTTSLALLIGAGLCAVLGWTLTHPAVRPHAGEHPSAKPLGFRIDLNVADAATLELLPGVGPNIAQNIVHARRDGAVFLGPDDLQTVKFIGPSLLSRVQPWVIYHEHQPAPGAAASIRQ